MADPDFMPKFVALATERSEELYHILRDLNAEQSYFDVAPKDLVVLALVLPSLSEVSDKLHSRLKEGVRNLVQKCLVVDEDQSPDFKQAA